MKKDKNRFYARYTKRVLDFFLSLAALCVLSPLLLLLTILGTIAMHGNPFFVQARPGRIGPDGKERIFNLIKFRTMTDQTDENGKLLPDALRLNGYGKMLRKTSLDELGELVNILKGDMSIIGPRPLLRDYLPYYTQEERLRHTVRPGLTGWAQINGRNNIRNWDERFQYDLEYVKKCSFLFDLKILFLTVPRVIKRSDILVGDDIQAGRLDDVRRNDAAYRCNQKV